jgi:hypothetical protein
MRKKIYVSQFDDPYIQENFKSLVELANDTPFFKGQWFFMSLPVIASGVEQKFPHNLPFTPLDIIVLSVVGGSVVFNYTKFDSTFINLDATVTSSPMTIRMFIGRHSEDTLYV